MQSKQITHLADGRFELMYAGQIVGYADTEQEAREQLNTIAYDAERGKPVLALVQEPELDDDNDRPTLLYQDTSHNTFMMIDTAGGLVYQVKDGSAPVIIKPEQVIALYQFLRRPTVELTVMHAMRRYLEADASEPMQKVLAILDANLPPLPPLPIAPAVRMERLVCDDTISPDCGKEIGTDYIIEAGEESVIVYFPDSDRMSEINQPQLLAFGENGWYLDQVDRVLPLMNAIMSDPRVIQMRQQIATNQPVASVAAAPSPTLHIEREDNDDYGVHAWCFKMGDGDSAVELYLPDVRGKSDNPQLYLLGHEGKDPIKVEQMLPNLAALFSDPQVKAARARSDAGLPAIETEQRKAA